MNDLTLVEATELERCETIIEKGVQTFIEVGNALAIVRDKKLYRSSYETFEEYCKERWGFTDRRARMLIDAAKVQVNLLDSGTVVPESERQTRPLTKLPPEAQAEVWQQAVRTAPNGKVTAKHVQETVDQLCNNKPEPSQNGMDQKLSVLLSHRDTEWYTPLRYIDAVRCLLGEIDLDPASSDQAQQTINATNYFTIKDDGLSREWWGRVFLNPPYSTTSGKSNQEIWSTKLSSEYERGNVTEAILLVKASLGYNWFEEIWDLYPVCFARELIAFVNSETGITGKAKLGSAFFYLGPNVDKFTDVFSPIGRIVIPEHTL